MCMRTMSSATASPALGVKNTLLFGTADSPCENVIPDRSLRKLPDEARERLFKLCDITSAHGEHVIYCLRNPTWTPSVLRLKEFLDHGALRIDTNDIEVVNESRQVATWNLHPPGFEAVSLTAGTTDLFESELKVFALAVQIHYPALQVSALQSFLTNFPILANETATLLRYALRTAAQLKDRELFWFIIGKAKDNYTKLQELPLYKDFMTELAQNEPFGHMFIERLFSGAAQQLGNGKATQQLSRTSPTSLVRERGSRSASGGSTRHEVVTRSDSPTAAPLVSYATSPTPSIGNPPTPSTSGPSTPLNTLQPQDLPKLQESLRSQQLLVATEDGYGTLLRPGPDFMRNCDFRFKRSELLIADHSTRSPHGMGNVVVQNSRGQRGDVLARLVKVVPRDFGVESELLPLVPELKIESGRESVDVDTNAVVGAEGGSSDCIGGFNPARQEVRVKRELERDVDELVDEHFRASSERPSMRRRTDSPMAYRY